MSGSGFPTPDPLAPGLPKCPACLRLGFHTPAEAWRKTPMVYCTFHYWLMRGSKQPHGFPLEVYMEHSRRFGFVLSLPSVEEMARMASLSPLSD